MAGQLQTTTIAAPGFYGLNTQESGVTLDNGFALEATNCVIDKFGRIGARKGWTFLAEDTGVNLKGAHRFIDIDGTEYFGAWSTNDFYIYSANTLTAVPVDPQTPSSITSSGTTATVTYNAHGYSTGDTIVISGATQTEYNGAYVITVTGANTFTYTFAGSATSPATGTLSMYKKLETDGNYQAATLNDAAFLFHKGEKPLYFNPTTSTLDFIEDTGKGTPPSGNTVLSAYGRLWVANTNTNVTTLYWSDLLDGTEWRSGTGTVGSLDISSILVYGNDEIVGIGAHNGYLIIFCKQNIVIMGDSDNNQTYLDPATMQLVEVISGIGCVSRDSIQNTGTDIIFLSESGVRSLGRTIQEKSQPMRDLSKNVRDDIVQRVETVDQATIKSCYSESNAFYLLAFTSVNEVYCFDMRTALQDGSARVTKWNTGAFTSWLGFDGEVYMTHNNGLARYFNYTDNGDEYRMSYYTSYLDFDAPTQVKLLKKLAYTLVGVTGQTFFAKAAFDYSDIFRSIELSMKEAVVAEYGIAEYNIAEYSGGTSVDNVRSAAGGSGSVLQLGFETDIDGGEISLQKMDIYVKQGRVL